MRHIVDKMPTQPTDCPFSQHTLHHDDWWCDQSMQMCPYFNDPKSSRISCPPGLVSMTGLISELSTK